MDMSAPRVRAEDGGGRAIQLLKLYDSQVHGLANKAEKPRRPELTMTGDAVEDTNWEQFVFKFEQYKTLAGVTKESSSH